MIRYIARHVAVVLGPDHYLFADCRLAIGFCAARRPDPYRHHKYRIWFSVSWDWLPKFTWLSVDWGADGYPAARWTGRRASLLRWSWLLRFDGRVEPA